MIKISFYLLSAEETFTLTKRIIEIIKKRMSKDEFALLLLPVLEEALNKLSDALRKIANKEMTRLISEADEVRDAAFLALRDYIKANSNKPDKKVKTAANKLLEVVRKVGFSLHREGDTVETALLHSLFAELDKPDCTKALNAVNAVDWYASLKEAQAGFEKVNDKKVQDESGKEIPLVGENKKVISKYLIPLLGYLEVKAELSDNEFKVTADQCDEVIEGVITIARARNTRRINSTEEETEVIEQQTEE